MMFFDEIRRKSLGYHPLLVAAINFANSNSYALPSLGWLDIINDLISGMETIIYKMDAFYIKIGDGSDGFKNINIAGNVAYNLTINSTVTNSVYGYRGAGGFLSTNFNPFTNLGSSNQKYKATNASRFMVVFASAGNGRIDGPADGSGSNAMINGNVDYQRINQAGNTNSQIPEMSGTGLKALCRADALGFEATNKSVTTLVSTGGSVVTNSVQNIFRYQSANSTVGSSIYGMGAYLTSTELQWIRTVVNKSFNTAGLTPVA